MYKKIISNLAFYLKRERRKIFNFFLLEKKYENCINKKKISAYLSIYNDVDLLKSAIDSVKKYVDELVVVDGAYDWMAPYLIALGRDPERSSEQLYKIIEDSGIPYKTINKTWKNEVEKRIAGFASCSHRYIMRIDADEVLFFDDKALNDFFMSKCAVAEMYMPTYVAPGYVLKGNRLIDKIRKFPRQSFIFDSEKISAEGHLKYLWLVLTADKLPNIINEKIYPVFERPAAFCAHLTNWRHSESSANRGAFYTMNWMRKNGAPWIKSFGHNPITDFSEFFKCIKPKIFNEIMQNSSFVYGDFKISKFELISKTPLKLDHDSSLIPLYQNYIGNIQSRIKKIIKNGSYILFNFPFYINVDLDSDVEDLGKNNKLNIMFGEDIGAVNIILHELRVDSPYTSKNRIEFETTSSGLIIDFKDIGISKGFIKRILEIEVIPKNKNSIWSTIEIYVVPHLIG